MSLKRVGEVWYEWPLFLGGAMSKLVMSLVSFAGGSLFAVFVLAGSHSLSVTHAQAGIMKMPSMEPVVPQLPTVGLIDSKIDFDIQALDGLNCENCEVNAKRVTYAGGPFRVPNCTIKTTQWQLKGAALNTYILLTVLGVIPQPAPRGKTIPPTMEANTIQIVPPQDKVDLVSYK
jgi:hypothetical protein